MIQESYRNNLPTLYLVPTPIGNMSDITIRAKEILNEVSEIYCEDTRVTGLLLKNIGIKKKLIACHKFNESKVSNEVINSLSDNKNVALVSDRGTPLISDPGYVIVKKVVEKGFNVIALPGASALLPALNMSGINSEKFLFYGFLNSKDSESKKELEMLSKEKFTIVLYESPHRLAKNLQNIVKIMGNRSISISREITKLYETVFRGTANEALEKFSVVKGEIVIVIEGYSGNNIEDFEIIFSEVDEEINNGVSSKDAIKLVSNKYGISKNLLYNDYERRKRT